MFGWNDDPNQVEPAYPLADLSFDDWWLHGAAYRNAPPKEGKFMELPSGGTYHGYTSCSESQIIPNIAVADHNRILDKQQSK